MRTKVGLLALFRMMNLAWSLIKSVLNLPSAKPPQEQLSHQLRVFRVLKTKVTAICQENMEPDYSFDSNENRTSDGGDMMPPYFHTSSHPMETLYYVSGAATTTEEHSGSHMVFSTPCLPNGAFNRAPVNDDIHHEMPPASTDFGRLIGQFSMDWTSPDIIVNSDQVHDTQYLDFFENPAITDYTVNQPAQTISDDFANSGLNTFPTSPLHNINLGVQDASGLASTNDALVVLPRPHICPVCGRSIMRKGDMERHHRSHGPRDLKCPLEQCGKGFYRKDKLVDHLKTHRTNSTQEHGAKD